MLCKLTKILREINGPDVLYTLSALGKGYGKGYSKNKRSRNLRAKHGRNRTRRK
jgi:hypothetical protein